MVFSVQATIWPALSAGTPQRLPSFHGEPGRFLDFVLNVVRGLTLEAFSRTKPPPATRCPRPLPLSWRQARPRPRRRCCQANRRGWQAPFHSGSAASSWCQRSHGVSLQTSVCQTCTTTSPSTACGADRPGLTLGMLGMPGHAPTAEPVSCPACQQACSCHVVCQHMF